MNKQLFSVLMASVFAVPALPAAANNETLANQPTSLETQSYEQAFFAQYSPQNAHDMIARLPGFILDQGVEARGFGATAGNVLIDGTRLTAKSGGIVEILTRIPATQVLRIEVRIGANSAGETAGQTMVANVIRKKDTSSGTWSAALYSINGNSIRPSFDASYSTKLMGWDTTLRLDTSYENDDRDALITRLDAEGVATTLADETLQSGPRNIAFSFDAARSAFGGKLQLNGRFSRNKRFLDLDRISQSLSSDEEWRNTLDGKRLYYTAEFGMDWSRTFKENWKLRLLGLYTYRDDKAKDKVGFEPELGTLTRASHFDNNWQYNEAIVRATIGKTKGRLKPEFGIEGTLNTMDNVFNMRVEDATGNTLSAPPADTVDVKERRAEAFANMIYGLSKTLTLSGGIRTEVSRISSDGGNSRSFTYYKPSIGLTYSPSEKLQLGLKYRRSVGQLSFADFAASNDAVNDRIFEGNRELRPDQTDRLEATFDYRLAKRTALSVKLFHDWNDDVLEQVILPSGGEGLANTNGARRWGATASATVDLDNIIRGGLLNMRLWAKDSRYKDPITGEVRRLRDEFPLVWSIGFRQDIPKAKLSYGVSYNSSEETYLYHAADSSHLKYEPRVNAFIETTQFFGVKARLLVTQAFGDSWTRVRKFYAGSRNGALTGSEIKEFHRDAGIKLTITRKF